MPASLMLALARTIRWAMVGSGTRNACAIWGVVSPPSSRTGGATWAAGRACPGAGGDAARVEAAGQDGHRTAVLLAEDTLDVGRPGRDQPQSPAISTMGRTSTGSVHATVALRAQPRAASRSGARMI